MNTNDYNVWIRQPLFAAELYEVDEHQWEHETVLVREESSDEIKVHFQSVPPADIQEEILTQSAQQTESKTEGAKDGSNDEEEPLLGVIFLYVSHG